MKKQIIALSLLMVLAVPFSVMATVDPVQEREAMIADLMAKIAALQAQINAIKASGSQVNNYNYEDTGHVSAVEEYESEKKWCHTFEKNIGKGFKGSEVSALVRVLAQESFIDRQWISESDSKTEYDSLVADGVSRLQEKYIAEILNKAGLTRGTGYLGLSTRNALNKLYGCNKLPETSRPTNALTVVSPNGGETWTIGSTQSISWKNDSRYLVNISLVTYPSCNTTACLTVLPKTYTLATNVSNITQENFAWTVGKTADGQSIPAASYTVKICNTLTNVCDSSDSYFKIVGADSAASYRDERRISDLKNVQLALELYADDNGGNFPANLGLMQGTYISAIPKDPGTLSQSGNGSYFYFASGKQYHIGADLEVASNTGTYDQNCDSTSLNRGTCFYPALNGGFDGTVASRLDFATKSASRGTFTLLTPNGGEQWVTNAANRITWTPDPESSSVEAYLDTKDSSGNYQLVGKILPSAKGSIVWNGDITSYGSYPTPGSGYYVRLVNKATGESDRSDASFTLLPSYYVKADLKANGLDNSINLLPEGATVYLSWSSTNALSCSIGLTGMGDNLANLPTSGSRQVFLKIANPAVPAFISLLCPSAYNYNGSDYIRVYPSNPSIVGKLGVSQHATSPQASTALGGASKVVASYLALSAAGEPVSLRTITLKTGGGNPSAISDIGLWDGATQIAVGVYARDTNSVTLSLVNPLIIPRDTTKLITVRVSLSMIGGAYGAKAGDTVSVGWTPGGKIEATGMDSGSAVTIVGYDFMSNLITLVSGTVTETNPCPLAQTATAVVRATSACPIVTAAKITINTTGGPHFTDVDSRDLNYNYIETLYNTHITSGCATGKFCPGDTLKRDQAMVLIVRAKGYAMVNPTTPTFSDVPTTHAYYKFIETAAANGLVQGYNGKFMPDDAITSADLSAALGKAFPK